MCETSLYIKIILKSNGGKPIVLHLYNSSANELLNELSISPENTTEEMSDANANIDTVQATYNVGKCTIVDTESISLD